MMAFEKYALNTMRGVQDSRRGDTETGMAAQEHSFNEDLLRSTAMALRDQDGPLLPILHALQERFGFIDERAIPIVADVLNLSRAEVQGVVSFYHDFRTCPPGRHVIKICQAEACQSMGANALVENLEAVLGIKVGQTTADGRVSLESVYCLGNCALSPAALIDGSLKGRLNVERILALLGETAS